MNTHPQGGAWESVAAESANLVFNHRGRIYSHPHDDYSSVVQILHAICPEELVGETTGAIFQMIAVKFARLRFGLEQGFPPSVLRDHFVDACGYIDCLWAVIEREFDYATEDAINELTSEE